MEQFKSQNQFERPSDVFPAGRKVLPPRGPSSPSFFRLFSQTREESKVDSKDQEVPRVARGIPDESVTVGVYPVNRSSR